jgi:hypothetical protein
VADSAATADDPEPSAAALPRGWESATSRSTGRTYYINLLTNESTYDVPTGPALGAEMERDQPLACGSPSSTTDFVSVVHDAQAQAFVAATKIQAAWRGHVARDEILLLHLAETDIQAHWRGKLHRLRLSTPSPGSDSSSIASSSLDVARQLQEEDAALVQPITTRETRIPPEELRQELEDLRELQTLLLADPKIETDEDLKV